MRTDLIHDAARATWWGFIGNMVLEIAYAETGKSGPIFLVLVAALWIRSQLNKLATEEAA